MSEREDLLEQQAIELHLNEAMWKVKEQKGNALKPKGTCHNCEEKVELEGQIFCDTDCRDDYIKIMKARS